MCTTTIDEVEIVKSWKRNARFLHENEWLFSIGILRDLLPLKDTI